MMNWARPVALALLALVGAVRAQGLPSSSYHSTGPIADALMNGKRPFLPPTVPYPTGDTIAPGYRIVLKEAVQELGPEGLWSKVRNNAGTLFQKGLKLGPGAGRLIAGNVVAGATMALVNYGLQRAFDEFKREASGADLKACFDYALGQGGPIDTSTLNCGTTFRPIGLYELNGNPPMKQNMSWVQVARRAPGVPDIYTVYYNIYYYSGYNGGAGGYDVRAVCRRDAIPSKDYFRYSVDGTKDPLDMLLAFTTACNDPEKQQQTPIPLKDYVEGSANTQPHPNVKQQIYDNVIKTLDEPMGNPLVPWPGVEFSKTTINQYTGQPVDPYLDTDGDGWSDAEEVARGSDPNDNTSKPDLTKDTDRDGVPDGTEDRLKTNPYDPKSKPDPEQLRDTDGDGIPDEEDPDDDNDGVPDEKDPEPLNKEVPVKCSTGFTVSDDGKTCHPVKEDPKCPDGQKVDETQTPPKCVVDEEKKDDPAGDSCGDFSIKRAMAHTAHYIRDIVFPCEPPADLLKPVVDGMKGKFPFSLTVSLKGWFQAPTGEGAASNLPDKLAIIPLEWGWLSGLWSTIKTLVGVALWAWFIYWLIDRFTPRAEI